ncbi:MAG TPA: hypothetical protein VMU69_16370 [Bradyrhizobium sp.]|nr:hypothetical protein [Bradyrhizobium sp.]
MSDELKRRIATALSSSVSSAEVAALIVEIVAAGIKSEEAIVAERTKASDQAASPGPEHADNAPYDQLNSALPKLQERLAELQAAESANAWEKDYQRVKAQIEKAARKWQKYPKLVAQLIDILDTAAIDREILRINDAAPAGEQRRLRGVELTARDLEEFNRYRPSVAKTVQLPQLEHSYKMAWPPPPPSLAAAYAALMLPNPSRTSRSEDG